MCASWVNDFTAGECESDSTGYSAKVKRKRNENLEIYFLSESYSDKIRAHLRHSDRKRTENCIQS